MKRNIIFEKITCTPHIKTHVATTHQPTDGHGGEQDGPEHHQDISAVDAAGAVVDALRVGLVVVGDLLGAEPAGIGGMMDGDGGVMCEEEVVESERRNEDGCEIIKKAVQYVL